MQKYLPYHNSSDLPVLFREFGTDNKVSERELLYKVLFDMKKDINDLKKLVGEIIDTQGIPKDVQEDNSRIIKNIYKDTDIILHPDNNYIIKDEDKVQNFSEQIQESEVIEEPLSLQAKEIDLIKRALDKYKGKRKNAAKELGISERTLYRKIKEYNLEND